MIRILEVAALLLLLTTGAHAATSLDRAKVALGQDPPDYNTAIPLLVTGAKRNDPGSLYLLGWLKEKGYGTAKDRSGAIQLFRLSASLGYYPATKWLLEAGQLSPEKRSTPTQKPAPRRGTEDLPTPEPKWENGEIIQANPSRVTEGKVRITFRVPMNIPLRHWYTCNFLNASNEVIASAHHVLHERVPTTSIVATSPSAARSVRCRP